MMFVSNDFFFLLLQASYSSIKSELMYADRIPLTAYVLIALFETKDVSGVIRVCCMLCLDQISAT